MTDNLKSASILAANTLDEALALIDKLETKARALEADAKALWNGYEVVFVAVIFFIAGFVIGIW